MIEKNRHYEILIQDIGKNGEGIGRIEAFTVFVDGALPGDLVSVELTKVKKRYGIGKLLEIVRPSLHRIEPKCCVSGICGGCTLDQLDYQEQLTLKTKIVRDDLERIGGFKGIKVNDIISMKFPYHYRNKAYFAVGEKNGIPIIGFYSPKSRNLVDVEECLIQNHKTKDILECVKAYMIENNISAFNEEDNSGIVKGVLTRIGHATGEIAVCIVINKEELPKYVHLIEKLEKIDGMKSISVSINKGRTKTNLGNKTKILWGEKFITDEVCGMKFEISPSSFFQVNSIQTEKLYNKVLEFANLSGDETVIDAYCGVGSISLLVAQRAKKIYGIEIVESAIKDAKRNASINSISNVEFILGASENIMPMLEEKENTKADVIIIDPPRKGCDERFIEAILEMKPKNIIYVSCDPATLARDLKLLCFENYEVQEVQPVDMFPMTSHVEVAIKLSKVEL